MVWAAAHTERAAGHQTAGPPRLKLAMRMLVSSWLALQPVAPLVVFTHPNCTLVPSVRFTCARPVTHGSGSALSCRCTLEAA